MRAATRLSRRNLTSAAAGALALGLALSGCGSSPSTPSTRPRRVTGSAGGGRPTGRAVEITGPVQSSGLGGCHQLTHLSPELTKLSADLGRLGELVRGQHREHLRNAADRKYAAAGGYMHRVAELHPLLRTQ